MRLAVSVELHLILIIFARIVGKNIANLIALTIFITTSLTTLFHHAA